MALSAANRNWLQVHHNEMTMLMAELLDLAHHRRDTITLAMIRIRMDQRGINTVTCDELITYYDTLGGLMDS